MDDFDFDQAIDEAREQLQALEDGVSDLDWDAAAGAAGDLSVAAEKLRQAAENAKAGPAVTFAVRSLPIGAQFVLDGRCYRVSHIGENGVEARDQQFSTVRVFRDASWRADKDGYTDQVQVEVLGIDQGARLKLTEDVDRYPHFIAREGMTGRVTHCDADTVCLRLDEHLPGCEEWDNELVFTSDDAHHARLGSPLGVLLKVAVPLS